VIVGPTFQTANFGWGTSYWGDSTWGTERGTTSVILDPGLWSLDNFGQILIATIHNGKTFTWDAGAVGARNTRATVMTGAPTTSRLTQVSDRDRHVFHFGTETTIGILQHKILCLSDFQIKKILIPILQLQPILQEHLDWIKEM
jgi:hypothetical protein